MRREGSGRRHKGVEKDILGDSFEREREDFAGRTLSLGPGRDLCLGLTQ